MLRWEHCEPLASGAHCDEVDKRVVVGGGVAVLAGLKHEHSHPDAMLLPNHFSVTVYIVSVPPANQRAIHRAESFGTSRYTNSAVSQTGARTWVIRVRWLEHLPLRVGFKEGQSVEWNVLCLPFFVYWKKWFLVVFLSRAEFWNASRYL